MTRERLVRASLTPAQLRHRLKTGALIREHPGVYRVGHRAPSLEADYLAAVLAAGPRAVLSGLAAAFLFGLVRTRPPAPEVTSTTKRHIKGTTTHRSVRLVREETTRWRGIPVTTVPRTLVDIAAVLSEDDLARACHEAGVRYGTTPRQVERVLARCPNAPGAGRLRRVLRGDAHVTLSKLEATFVKRLREAGLPLPRTNRRADGRRLDCRWPAHRLTVELDSYRYHSSRHAWEQDRRREREAHARGDEFRRYTHDDVMLNLDPVLAELRPLLAAHLAG